MKSLYAVFTPVFAFGLVTALRADAKPKIINPETIKDEVSIALGQEFVIEFKRDGDRLLQPSKSNGKVASKASVKIDLKVTSESPVPPPRKGATRPFLWIKNNFENALHFSVLARLKGSKEFFEISEGIEPLPAGEVLYNRWDCDSLVEEVILYEFKVADKPAK